LEIKKKNYKSALNAVKCARTGMFNVPALVRSHPLYILLRVSRELCFC